MPSRKQRQPKQPTKAGAVELDESKLDQASGGYANVSSQTATKYIGETEKNL